MPTPPPRFSRSFFDDSELPLPEPQYAIPEPLSSKPDRPIGLSILAVLHLLGGLVLFAIQFLLWTRVDQMKQPLQVIGMPPVILLAGVMFLSLLGIISGIGMWTGARWGWWVAAFYYVYGVFRNAGALIAVAQLAEHLEGGPRGPAYYVVKHSGRIVVHALILLYLMKANVLEFFDQQSLSKPKALGLLAAICTAIAATTSALSMLFG